MKGIIFTEFFELVENAFSVDVAEEMLELAKPDSGGVYTSVGSYDHMELLRMVDTLSSITAVPTRDLVMVFGEHLFGRFTQMYPGMFIGKSNCFDFIESVEGVIHVQVRKLYPDAQLPRIQTDRTDDGSLNVVYRSPRQLGDVAHALLSGCVKHFGESLDIHRLDGTDDNGPYVHFRIQPVQSEVEACSM